MTMVLPDDERSSHLPFSMKLVGSANTAGIWTYAFREQAHNTVTDAYSDMNPGRMGTTTVDYAREINNREIDVSSEPIVRGWFRSTGAFGSEYEFDGSGLAAIGSAGVTVEESDGSPSIAATTIQFYAATVSGGGGTALVTIPRLSIFNTTGGALVVANTTSLYFADCLIATTNTTNTATVTPRAASNTNTGIVTVGYQEFTGPKTIFGPLASSADYGPHLLLTDLSANTAAVSLSGGKVYTITNSAAANAGSCYFAFDGDFTPGTIGSKSRLVHTELVIFDPAVTGVNTTSPTTIFSVGDNTGGGGVTQVKCGMTAAPGADANTQPYFWIGGSRGAWANTGGLTFQGGLYISGNSTASNASLITSGILGVAYGGTGQSSYTAGDLLYASNTTVIAKLGIGTNGHVLKVSSSLPAWAASADLDSLGSPSAGDIIYYNGGSWARLPIGSDGQVLTVVDAGMGQIGWVTP